MYVFYVLYIYTYLDTRAHMYTNFVCIYVYQYNCIYVYGICMCVCKRRIKPLDQSTDAPR